MVGSGEKPKRRLFRLLRRGTRESSAGGRTIVEESELWAAHGRAASAVRATAEAAGRIASQVAKQRAVVDGLVDRTRSVSSRSSELATSFGRLNDAFARLELVALNAGLEGARLGEGPGHALGLVSDEIRGQASRGSEACRELGLALGELGSELVQVHASLDRVRDASADVAQEAAHVGGASADADRALVDVGDRLKKASGSDPETASAIAAATEHARALVAVLAGISGKAPEALILAALRPALEPVLRFFDREEGDV